MDASTVLRSTTILGLSSSIWLSGIYFSSSQLTLPILYRLPTAISTDVFQEFYHRGVSTIVPLTVSATVFWGVSAYLDNKKRRGYALAGALALASLPWTIFVMMNTIEQLIDISKHAAIRETTSQAAVVALLQKWKWMNFVRAGLALAGGMTGLLGFTAEV